VEGVKGEVTKVRRIWRRRRRTIAAERGRGIGTDAYFVVADGTEGRNSQHCFSQGRAQD